MMDNVQKELITVFIYHHKELLYLIQCSCCMLSRSTIMSPFGYRVSVQAYFDLIGLQWS